MARRCKAKSSKRQNKSNSRQTHRRVRKSVQRRQHVRTRRRRIRSKRVGGTIGCIHIHKTTHSSSGIKHAHERYGIPDIKGDEFYQLGKLRFTYSDWGKLWVETVGDSQKKIGLFMKLIKNKTRPLDSDTILQLGRSGSRCEFTPGALPATPNSVGFITYTADPGNLFSVSNIPIFAGQNAIGRHNFPDSPTSIDEKHLIIHANQSGWDESGKPIIEFTFTDISTSGTFQKTNNIEIMSKDSTLQLEGQGHIEYTFVPSSVRAERAAMSTSLITTRPAPSTSASPSVGSSAPATKTAASPSVGSSAPATRPAATAANDKRWDEKFDELMHTDKDIQQNVQTLLEHGEHAKKYVKKLLLDPKDDTGAIPSEMIYGFMRYKIKYGHGVKDQWVLAACIYDKTNKIFAYGYKGNFYGDTVKCLMNCWVTDRGLRYGGKPILAHPFRFDLWGDPLSPDNVKLCLARKELRKQMQAAGIRIAAGTMFKFGGEKLQRSKKKLALSACTYDKKECWMKAMGYLGHIYNDA